MHLPKTPCQHCHKDFVPKTSWQHFCSAKCRNLYHSLLRKEAIAAFLKNANDKPA